VPKEVPLVIYKNDGERVVIGTAMVYNNGFTDTRVTDKDLIKKIGSVDPDEYSIISVGWTPPDFKADVQVEVNRGAHDLIHKYKQAVKEL